MAWKVGIALLREKCRNGGRTGIGFGCRSRSAQGFLDLRPERISGMAYSGRVLAVSAALLLCALVGCTEDSASTSPPTDPPSSSTSPTSDPTTEPPTDADVAEKAAERVVREYVATVDRLRQDPKQSIEQLKAVAIGGELDAQTIFTNNQREAGNRQVGDTEVVEVITQAINLNSTQKPPVPVVQLDVCWDVSAGDVVDRDGKSIVNPDRAERGWSRYTVTNHRWMKDPEAGWRVASSQDLEKAPCSAA